MNQPPNFPPGRQSYHVCSGLPVYERLRLGMSRAEVEQLLLEHPSPRLPMASVFASFDWEGLVAGEVRRVHFDDDHEDAEADIRVMAESWHQYLEGRIEPQVKTEKGYRVCADRTTGRVLARGRERGGRLDSVYVVFDGDDRLTEKAYNEMRPQAPWWERTRRAIAERWPF